MTSFRTSFRTLIFNSYLWIQTLLSFLLSEIISISRDLIGVTSDQLTDPAWMGILLQKKFKNLPPPITSIEKCSQTLFGQGLVGQVYKIELMYAPAQDKQRPQPSMAHPADYPRHLVVKQNGNGFRARLQSTSLQSAREGIFYSTFAPRHAVFKSCLPDVYHSRGSLLTGKFQIVMEDLTENAVPASHMLGNQCWGDPASPLPEELKSIEALEVVRTIFGKMAAIHVRFWMDETLLREEWMKGVRWRKGKDRLSWEAAFDSMRARWTNLLAGDGGGRMFTSLQKETFERLLAGTTWERWHRQNGVKPATKPTTCYTLAHGDFHAGNVLWMIGKQEDQAIFVDWSEVGVGCPFTELAQFLISNTSIEFRREHERQLFDEHYKQLVNYGVDSEQFPPEMCWELYKAGGIERWLQLLILLAAARLPEFALLWYSRQVDSFLQDHHSSLPKCFNTVYCLPLS